MSGSACSTIWTNPPGIRSSSRCPATCWWSARIASDGERRPSPRIGERAEAGLLCRLALAGLLQVAGRELPVDEILQEGRHVVGAAVLIVEVIGVLPHIEGEERRL